MITCRELAELLLEFETGELPPDRQERIERHLVVCSPCMCLVESYRHTISLSRRLPCAPLPAPFEARLRAVVEKHCQDI
jgi:anti-sigma factor RsiW